MKTKLSGLIAAEAKNLEGTTKHLGASADLVGDVESLYQIMTPLLKSSGKSSTSSGEFTDEQLATVSIFNELMMCRMFLTKAELSLLRMYQAEALTHVRRAIESCAFAVRMSKHHALSRVWSEAGRDNEGEETKYKAYRKAFKPEDVFPKANHPDHDPLLTELHSYFDLCSKQIHGSIFGMASHLANVPKGKNTDSKRSINFFDMPSQSLVSCLFLILHTYKMILQLFGQILKPYCTDFEKWKKEYLYVEGKIERHRQKWLPTINAQIAARNQKRQSR